MAGSSGVGGWCVANRRFEHRDEFIVFRTESGGSDFVYDCGVNIVRGGAAGESAAGVASGQDRSDGGVAASVRDEVEIVGTDL